jgi:hypothetical protein
LRPVWLAERQFLLLRRLTMLENTPPVRYIALDIHKEYLVACGVNAEKEAVFDPQRVDNQELETWIQK